MTEQPNNVPAVREERREIATTDTDSWIPVAASVIKLAEFIAPTEFVPKSLRNSSAATAAAILYGREVGLPPMTALTQTHVIEGKPAMSAEAMRAMVLAAGHDLVVEETTGAKCRMRARRTGSDQWTTLEWSIDMARAAGVAGKQVWKSYPRQMLQARCTTELVRLVFPDVIHGFRSLEELDRLDSGEAPEEQDDSGSTTAVQRGGARKRAAAPRKTSTAQAPTAPSTPAAGPPLPGEPGYDDPAETSTGGEAQSGEGVEPPVDPDPSPAPDAPQSSVERPDSGSGAAAVPDEDQGASAGEADEIHDAEIVEETPGASSADDDESSLPVRGDGGGAPGPRLANRAQVRAVNTILSHSFNVVNDDRHRVVSALIGRTITSVNQVTADEISPMLDALKLLDSREALDAIVLAAEQRRAANEDAES